MSELMGKRIKERLVDLDKQKFGPKIPLHTIKRSLNPKTMRVKGKLGDYSVVILIDSSSTHKFVKSLTIIRTKLRVQRGKRFQVKVANEKVALSKGKL